jgi:hypothetical protein
VDLFYLIFFFNDSKVGSNKKSKKKINIKLALKKSGGFIFVKYVIANNFGLVFALLI